MAIRHLITGFNSEQDGESLVLEMELSKSEFEAFKNMLNLGPEHDQYFLGAQPVTTEQIFTILREKWNDNNYYFVESVKD